MDCGYWFYSPIPTWSTHPWPSSTAPQLLLTLLGILHLWDCSIYNYWTHPLTSFFLSGTCIYDYSTYSLTQACVTSLSAWSRRFDMLCILQQNSFIVTWSTNCFNYPTVVTDTMHGIVNSTYHIPSHHLLLIRRSNWCKSTYFGVSYTI